MSNAPGIGRRAMLATAVAAVSGSRAGLAASREISFRDMPRDRPLLGLSAGLTGGGSAVQWRIIRDTSTPDGGGVLAEISRDRTDYRFPQAVVDDVELTDVSVTTRFRPVEGREDQAAGLVVRYRDARNYYVARANALEDNVRLYRVRDGRREQFAGADIKVPSRVWSELTLGVVGDLLTVRLDGQRLYEARDRTLPNAGKVGVWTKSDSLIWFEWLRIQPL